MKYFQRLLLSLSLLLLLNNNCFAATEFVSAINKTGEDYNTITLWEAAMDDAGDITASDVKVFSHGGITGTVSDLDTVTGQSSSATGTVIHSSSTQILIDAISGTFSSGEEVRVTSGNSVTISDAGDSPIIVAEVYDDDGDLDDGGIVIEGFTTDATNYIKITAPVGERHDGTATGTTIRNTSAVGNLIILKEAHTILEWLVLEVLNTGSGSKAIQISQWGVFAGDGGYIIRNNIIDMSRMGGNGSQKVISGERTDTTDFSYIQNNIIHDQSTWQQQAAAIVVIDDYYILNNTLYNVEKGIVTMYPSNAYAYNNIIQDSEGDAISASGTSWDAEDYNIVDDTTSTGANSQDSVTLSFVDIATDDYHLDSTDTEAIDAGTDLGTTNGVNFDIDNRNRDSEGDTWDIGADEYVSVGGGGRTRRMFITQ